MKRAFAILTVLVSTLALSAMTFENEAAVVIHNSGCNLLLADGSIGYLSADRDVRVYTSGPSLRMCQGKIENPTGRTIHYDADNTGMLCDVNGDSSSRWNETISASGHVTLVCRVK